MDFDPKWRKVHQIVWKICLNSFFQSSHLDSQTCILLLITFMSDAELQCLRAKALFSPSLTFSYISFLMPSFIIKFYFLAVAHSIQDLNFLTRDQTHTPCSGREELFVCFWLRWVFVALHRLSLVAVRRSYSSCSAPASHCGGFSCFGAQALGARAPTVVACRICVVARRICIAACGIFLCCSVARGGLPEPGM